MPISFGGVYPPLVTPFERSGRLDLKAFRENLRGYHAYGLRGYLVTGSSGEAFSLTLEERVRLIETARRETPADKILLVGTGTQSLQETIRLNQVAASNEADAVLVLPPFYYKSAMTHEVLLDYYRSVAKKSKIPVLVYSIPQFTGYSFSVSTVAALSRVKNIAGMKESSGNVSYLSEIIDSCSPGFQSLSGSALTFTAALGMGAVGGILALADVAPRECVEIFAAYRRGDFETAIDKQRKVIALGRALTARYGIAGLKAGTTLAGFQGGYPRSPLRPLPQKDQAVIRALFKEMRSNWP
ncbi:MAG: dihydrodipicolinate synthase family protein [Acidobacteriia bacterium]|nr:dihydrodipicolinate synthase family protein [Terriglobia bacterium]